MLVNSVFETVYMQEDVSDSLRITHSIIYNCDRILVYCVKTFSIFIPLNFQQILNSIIAVFFLM